MTVDIRVDVTPNPNAMKFTATKPLFEGRVIHKKGDYPDHPLAAQLLDIEGVDNIFGYQDFVTINKTFDANWDDLLPKVQQVFNNYNNE